MTKGRRCRKSRWRVVSPTKPTSTARSPPGPASAPAPGGPIAQRRTNDSLPAALVGVCSALLPMRERNRVGALADCQHGIGGSDAIRDIEGQERGAAIQGGGALGHRINANRAEVDQLA